MGDGSSGQPRVSAPQSGRQYWANVSPGVQYMYFIHGELQPPALQRGERFNLFYTVVRDYAVPVYYGSYRHGRNGRDHECPQQEDNQNDWQLLGLPRVEFYPYFAASFSGSWVHPDYAGYANGV